MQYLKNINLKRNGFPGRVLSRSLLFPRRPGKRFETVSVILKNGFRKENRLHGSLAEAVENFLKQHLTDSFCASIFPTLRIPKKRFQTFLQKQNASFQKREIFRQPVFPTSFTEPAKKPNGSLSCFRVREVNMSGWEKIWSVFSRKHYRCLKKQIKPLTGNGASANTFIRCPPIPKRQKLSRNQTYGTRTSHSPPSELLI